MISSQHNPVQKDARDMTLVAADISKKVTIVGAGIFGLWQAYLLARSGHETLVIEQSSDPFAHAASQYAGAMIAPFCEAESAEPIVRDLGFEAAALWRKHYPGLIGNGSLVVAGARDQGELKRFARLTEGHETIGGEGIATLEPDLAGRFQTALFYKDEGHMITPNALVDLKEMAEAAGARFVFGSTWADGDIDAETDVVIDCRGTGASAELPTLRGVRGERILIRSHDVALHRPIRLLHPRHAFYAVPWDDGRVLLGATLIESEDETPMTVRSALELLGMAYALHPGFGEAEILELSSGVRPSYPDNIPRVVVREGGRRIFVNGAYRHGFLLAPMLAAVTRGVINGPLVDHPLLIIE